MMSAVPSPAMSTIIGASPNLSKLGNSIKEAGSSYFLKKATSSTLGPEGSLPLTRPLLPPSLLQLSATSHPPLRESTDSLPPQPPAQRAE
ncbi:hypothetical protein E2562_025673 [Oryza meyeriana var. granulata]|uniref:Uncharacterized protein n=1 Tax=Oryza meyeriana var. granulata TaxID=110450 RepID=A0A6G1FCA5_9ORYZ|nr:hypothetical protein E2562_025673 [Oryza meyeriana var. granulata]